MATSGTVNQTVITVDRFLAHACKMAGLKTSEIVGETALHAKENLFMLLSAVANRGITLWTHGKVLLPTTPSRINYDMASGTVDVTNVLFRTMQFNSNAGNGSSSAGGTTANAFDQDVDTACTQTSANGNFSCDFGSAITITTAGYMSNGAATLNLVFEASTDNVVWTQILAPGSASYPDKEFVWYDIDATALQAQFFRVRETGGATLSAREVAFCTTPQETPAARLNVDQYTALTDKTQTGNQILQFYVQRLQDFPRLLVWTPGNSYFSVIVCWRWLQIEDPGDLQNELQIPQRWSQAVKYALAVEVAIEHPGRLDPTQFALLEKRANTAMFEAESEERDPSPIFLGANISAYTR